MKTQRITNGHTTFTYTLVNSDTVQLASDRGDRLPLDRETAARSLHKRLQAGWVRI